MLEPTWIALVDDDLSVRRSLPRLLRSAGYEALAFASAHELLDYEHLQRVSCFVLDIHLGRTTGFELLEKLRAAGSKAPAIFITAYDDDTSRERARALDAAGFLRKPFDGSALLDVIARVIEKKKPDLYAVPDPERPA